MVEIPSGKRAIGMLPSFEDETKTAE